MAQKKKGGFFSSLGQAIESVADSVDKAAKDVSKDLTNTVSSPMDHLKVGNIVIIISRTCGKCLRVLDTGIVEFTGNAVQQPEAACRLEVVASGGPNPRAIKLRSVLYPHFYMAIVNGYFVGYGQGGPECDFIPSTVSESGVVLSGPGTWVTFEAAIGPGSHLGVLPSGQITAPAQTPKTTTAAHFRVNYVDRVQAQATPQAQPQVQSSMPPAQPQYPPPQVQAGPQYTGPPPSAEYTPSAPPPIV